MSKKRSGARRGKAPPTSKRKPAAADDDIANNPAIGAYVTRARALRDNGQIEAAIRVFKQAVGLAPSNAKLRYEYGKMLVNNRRLAEGTEELEAALSIDSGFVAALVELGQAYIRNNQRDKARPLIEDALERQPNNAGLHIVNGTLKQHQAQLPEAIESFRQGLSLRLSHPTKDKTPPPKTGFGDEMTEQLLWDTLSELAKAGVHAFACYGTLLGLVRDGRLMPFDKDIDLGLPHCEMEKARQCLENNGWVHIPAMGLTNPVAFIHPVKNITVDLSGFVVDPATDTTYTGFWLDDVPTNWQRHTFYPPVELEKSESPTGQPIWSLSNPRDWLEAIYGADWKVPDPTFDTVIAARNLCDFSPLTQCYAFQRIYKHWDQGNLKRALALIDHTLAHLPDDELIQKIRDQITVEAANSGPNTAPDNAIQSVKSNISAFEEPDATFDNAFGAEDDTLRFDQ